MMGARVTEHGFVLRYDQKSGPSKVVTSLTTLGYLVLIARYIVAWWSIGQEQKRRCAERRGRAYRPDGLPVLDVDLA